MYLLTVEYLDFDMYSDEFGLRSSRVRQSTACSMTSHIRSWSEMRPFRKGVEGEIATIMEVKGTNMSYRCE